MASYQYEQLNGESFQQLSQSLLIRKFPNLQCFPVGQPDGGRDAISQIFESAPNSTGFIMFQVKFARRELSPSEARAWLLRTLRDELPKVQAQMVEGAEQFVLITNVPGTAHPVSGSIDKLQAMLDEHIPIPAQAWWREDLDRRLDDAYDLKLAYPAILSGIDMLRLIMEQGPSEDRERRQNAITAFLSNQFDSDREVKFKQVELENDLFDLFTDVPLAPRNPTRRRRKKAVAQLATAFRRVAASASNDVGHFQIYRWIDIVTGREEPIGSYGQRDDVWMGTASLLLDRDFQQAEPLVILEGAPGQGKSTIAQYICQVHRVRFLGIREYGSVARNHLDSPVRFPVKVELRDFATWLSGGNPFGSVVRSGSPDASIRSLEGFLAELIRNASGGSVFNVSDLQTTLKSTPTLVVLDGLDEVAEINQRQRVVKEINSAIIRLNALAKSLQVVVTTRPTPFMNSTVLPSQTFATYSIESLTRPLIIEYTDRWVKSREIDEIDAKDVRQILDDKLDEAHLRDLARNPMQLAILLSLIHRRGVSLPDKRTALYDNYIEIFFDREAAKATVVRDNRDLLIRIHRYLAWVLHADAEIDSESTYRYGIRRTTTSLSGAIAEHDLKKLLRDFLERDGSDSTLVEKLFSGMVERVVAIVSRVQGLYEFDVQTLREYFAARHLYETAPYSPVGDERRGTISDRWRALSRNYYWLNVARFYAGCYSEGELPSLVDDLRALSDDEMFRTTNHPQLLTATLLRDWVFSQRPRATQDAVDILLEPRGLRMLIADTWPGLPPTEDVIVRDPAGRARLLAACKDLVSPNRPVEEVMDVVRRVLRPNFEPGDLFDWWLDELRSANKTQLQHWCALGEYLQIWSVIDHDTVTDLLDGEEIPSSMVIGALINANRIEILESDENLFKSAVETVLSGARVGGSADNSILQRLAWSVDLMPLIGTHDSQDTDARRLSLLEYLNRFSVDHYFDDDITWPSYAIAESCVRLVRIFTNTVKRPLVEWSTSIDLWNLIVHQGITEFGERKRFVELANIAAGIRSKEERCQDSPNLFDCERPLVRRARYARLRAGSRTWWSRQLQLASSREEVWTALLIFATWSGAKAIEELSSEFDSLVIGLEDSEWQSLYSSLTTATMTNSNRSWIRPLAIDVEALPPSLNSRTATLLARRCTQSTKDDLYERYLSDYQGKDSCVLALCAEVQIHRAIENQIKWTQAIDSLRSSYNLGVSVSGVIFQRWGFGHAIKLTDAVAREVVAHPLEFPSILVRVAEAHCRQLDVEKIRPVGQVAAEEGWFHD